MIEKLYTSWKNREISAENLLLEIENLINNSEIDSIKNSELHYYLNFSSKTDFLMQLENTELLNRWAETTYTIIRKSDYTLLEMFSNRVAEIPENVMFQDLSTSKPRNWSYKKINSYAKEIAATFYLIANNSPRVAIFSDNSVPSAVCDLACLFYDIPDTPLNTTFSSETLIEIFNLLSINIVVTDTIERFGRLDSIRDKVKTKFIVMVTNPNVYHDNQTSFYLDEEIKKYDNELLNSALFNRKRLSLNQTATVMFTSGSTGIPKGLSFSIYNLVTKRFARSAAVPFVGKDEVMLCYLPLFHTFGRYLELLGSIYWRGTYTFTGNTSSETLLSLFPKVNPTVFISIPLRWLQLYESAMDQMCEIPESEGKINIFRQTVGLRLKWGLSAAGYLDPKVFQFFRRNGVELCSGFGMTEATGGITMTPPGNYIENSVGKPLPGVTVTMDENNEMLISGHYIARFYEDAPLGSLIPYPDETDYKIKTGDIFSIDENGYYEIVDRIKDIYKNNRGQTVAPKNVENKFEGVPGFKRTFLVGDGKPYNVLFVVPDKDDEVLANSDEKVMKEYYHQIITKVNQELASYERVINFMVLPRDFSAELGELTAKGSANRKTILKNFANEIDELYLVNYIDLKFDDFKVRVQLWIYRDLGILEDDIIIEGDGIRNIRSNTFLRIKQLESGNFIIGDLEYSLTTKTIELSTFARQPKLWVGNPQLMKFCPFKEGWDLPFADISENIFLPWNRSRIYEKIEMPTITKSHNTRLNDVNILICTSLLAEDEIALEATEHLSDYLKVCELRTAHLIRKRLESLARHPNEDIRCAAYKILLLDEPESGYSRTFPAFILSGLTFLNEKSIKEIASSKLEIRRLEALRMRMYKYRNEMDLPVNDSTRRQFMNLFKLLLDFIKLHPYYYSYVRYELISWMMYKKDELLAEIAGKYFYELHTFYEKKLDRETPKRDFPVWNSKLVFDEGISKSEILSIQRVLINTAFLKQSVLLIYDAPHFDITDVQDEGVWISRLNFDLDIKHYRICLLMNNFSRYELQLFIMEDNCELPEIETILWQVTIAGYPFGIRVVPKLGAYRPEFKAWSFAFPGELSLWAKIREYNSRVASGRESYRVNELRRLFVSAISAIFRSWNHSGKNIVPGILSPNNVLVPELDFRDGSMVNSIDGWKYYQNPTSLINPIIKNFFIRTIAHYPWAEKQLEISWIFDAAMESLGNEEAINFLNELKNYLESVTLSHNDKSLYTMLVDYIENSKIEFYKPLPLLNAISRYKEWLFINKTATSNAKEQTLEELMSLYNLEKFPEIVRYYLYRYTYFEFAENEILQKFDLLLDKMFLFKDYAATQMTELSDLQAVINDAEDRKIFTKMIFPKSKQKNVEVLKAGDKQHKHVIVQSYIKDNQGEVYNFREPTGPAEIGQLYRIFFQEKYPKHINENDEYIVLADSQDRIVGGICFRREEDNAVLIDGVVIFSSLSGRGIGTAMIDDFCDRMAAFGVEAVKTHFFMQNFYLRLGFKVNDKWGALVRFLNKDKKSEVQGNYCVI